MSSPIRIVKGREKLFSIFERNTRENFMEEGALGLFDMEDDLKKIRIIEIKNLFSYYPVLHHNQVEVPKKLSMSLLRLCAYKHLYPIFGHTHPKYEGDPQASFSKEDYCFIDNMVHVAHSMGVFNIMFYVCNECNCEFALFQRRKRIAWREGINDNC